MSLLLTGQVINVLITPTGTNREGQSYGGDHQVQILGETSLQNGEIRKELVTLRTENPESFKKATGKTVAVPVGAFVRNNGIVYYMPKGATPKELTPLQPPAHA